MIRVCLYVSPYKSYCTISFIFNESYPYPMNVIIVELLKMLFKLQYMEFSPIDISMGAGL